jgi:hypothetical protein
VLQDVRAVFGDYGYGGAGQLALVRLDETLAPLANRMELALPASQVRGSSQHAVLRRVAHRLLQGSRGCEC